MSKWTLEEDQLLQSGLGEGLTLKEAAERVGKTTGAANSRIYRLSKNGSPYKLNTRKVEHPAIHLRAAVFDLETMDFKTGGIQAHLVCCSILPLEAENPSTYQMRFEDNRDDRRLLGQVIERLGEFDILIGHNIAAFDLGWLYSRNMYFGFSQLSSWLYYDTYQVAKTMAIKAENKSLGALAAYFGVPGIKTAVYRTQWSMIDSPIREEFDEVMAEIVFHCEHDVKMNRGLFNALWQYDPKRDLKKTKW